MKPNFAVAVHVCPAWGGACERHTARGRAGFSPPLLPAWRESGLKPALPLPLHRGARPARATFRLLAMLMLAIVALTPAFAGVTLTPHNGVLQLPAPSQPKFTIVATLPSPHTAIDGNGNTATDTIVALYVFRGTDVVWATGASSYNSLWTDPAGALGPGSPMYTVMAMGHHHEAYSYWSDGYWQEEGHYEEDCHEVEDGYWDENDNWVVTGTHTECETNWVVDGHTWVDGHWEYGIRQTWVSFGTASLTFHITSLQAATALTPFNNSTALASPAQPRFTITSTLSHGRTVTDGLGNTRTDSLACFQIHNATHGWFDNLSVGGSSHNALWTDPRAGLGPGVQTYTVHTWGIRWDAYDNGWVDGHWREEGHWAEECHEEEEGYWEDGNWVVTNSYTECNTVWVVDRTWWVAGYRDTGFTSRFEHLSEEVITFTISTGTPQTITFPPIATHSWGEPPFTLNATASSGLPITYTVASGPATVTSNVVSLTGTGSVTITAHQHGNAAYAAAPPVSRTFTVVSGQPQTITFPAIANRTFGEAPFVISASASSNLPVTFAVTAGEAAVNGATVSLTGAGSVTITATQAGNATFSPAPPVSRSFAVAKSTQAIEFPPPANRVDGDAPFTLTALASSFLPVTFSVLSGPATVSDSTLTLTGPGTVTVRATQAGDSRYHAAPAVDRSFNVALGPNGRTLTVENGVANAIGGNAGAVITISASVPSGQHFTGWVVVSGTGSVADVASPNTTFTMGATAATVRATWSGEVPSYGLAWTEINLPTSLTASSSQAGSYATVIFGGIVTNTGTAAWSRFVTVEIRDIGNALVGFGGWVNGVSGLAPGGRAPLVFVMLVPNALTSSFYTFRAIDYANYPAQIGPPSTRMLTMTARTAAPPEVQPLFAVGTVGAAFGSNVSAAYSPTSYAVVGSLPPGLALNASTGAVSGTPTTAGAYAPTIVATNPAGNGASTSTFNIYSNTSHALSVTAGTASSSSLTVGASASVTANSPPNGQIFNGWSVQNGPGVLADWRSPATSVRLDAPGDLSVRANFVAGSRLVVVNGASTPLGGPAGASVAIAADPDGVGTMFDHWSTSGPGSIVAPQQQATTFTMGPAGATVTANFVPGYRLSVFGGGAGAAGGLRGSEVAIWPGASPGGAYQFLGFWLEGPGYLIGNDRTVVMGTGPARVHAAWWPVSSGPITRTILWPPSNLFALYKDEPFDMLAYTDYPGGPPPTHAAPAGLLMQIDYSTDGGNTWDVGIQRTPDPELTAPSDYNYRWRVRYRRAGGFPNAGRVVFRARADLPHLRNPVYFYLPVTVLNVDAATFLVHPTSMSTGAGQEAVFEFKAKGNGGNDVTYQWQKDGVDLPGRSGTAASDSWIRLTLPSVQPGEAGMYTVKIRSGMQGLWITSQPARLVVECHDPTILVQPIPATVAAGGTASFSVSPGGPGPFSFQWRKNGTVLSGATSSFCTLANVQAADAGQYSVTVSNPCGAIDSSQVALVVSTAAPPQPDPANQNQLNIHLP